jgi:hypothetical protein
VTPHLQIDTSSLPGALIARPLGDVDLAVAPLVEDAVMKAAVGSYGHRRPG